MTDGNYWLNARRRISRRAALRGAAVGAAGLAGAALIGCGDDDDDDGGGPTATSTPATTGTPGGTSTPAPDTRRGGIRSAVAANVYETVDGHQTVASPVLGPLGRAQSKITRFTNPNSGEWTGDLAETVEVVSGTEIILHVRQGVKWHDAGPGANNPAAAPGRDLTPEDIVWNIERQKAGLLADGNEGSFGRKSYWNKVASATADATSVRLELASPDGTFLEGMANEFNVIGQPELLVAVEANATEISADKVIGTGPYILTEWVPGERVSAVRNPNFYDENFPLLDGIVWGQAFEDPTAYRIGFEQKQVDSFSDPDPETTLAIHDSLSDETYTRFSGVANTVAAYTNPNVEPWNDLRLVKAINLALDRRLLIQQLHNGLGKVSGPVSWMQEAWTLPQEEYETIPGYRIDKAQDLKEANELWIAAEGASLGQIDWVIAETWAARASWTITPELIAGMFNDAFGTNQFRGVTKSYGEIIPSWFAKTFDPFFAWIPNIEIPDARADMISAFHSTSPANIFGVNEPVEIDAKLDAAAQELDREVAFEILREVQEYVLDNGQFGRHIAYNYIFPGLQWNYLQTTGPTDGEGWNFLAGSLEGLEEWIDTDDPTFNGRQTPTPTPV